MIYKFESMQQMADYFAKRASDLRARIRPDYTAVSKRGMRAEAHGYEQAASVIASAIIEPSKDEA